MAIVPRSNGGLAPFDGKRRVDAKYAIEWAKKRLRTLHREACAAGKPSPLTEPAAHLYLLLACEVLDNRYITGPLVLGELRAVMHCEPITVRRARQLLQALGEIRRVKGGQGAKEVRFAFVRMGGPLFAEALAGGDLTSILEIEVSRNFDPKDRSDLDPKDRSERQLRSQRSRFGADDYVPSVVVGRGSSTTTEQAAAGTRDDHTSESPAAADVVDHESEFFEWITAEYASCMGVPYPGSVRTAATKMQELAASVGWPFLRAMVCEMFAVTSDGIQNSNRDYIASSDRSLHVLHRKAQYLREAVLMRRAAADRRGAANRTAAESQPQTTHLDDDWRTIVAQVTAAIGAADVAAHLTACRLRPRDTTSLWLFVPTCAELDALHELGADAVIETAAAAVLPGMRLVWYAESALPLTEAIG